MHRLAHRLGTIFLAVVLAASAAPSTGRAADGKEQAKKHFDRGVELADEGHLQEALVEFQRAYDLTKHYAVLFNIGQVLVSLARPVEAVSTYERYLAEGGKAIDQGRRAKVQKEIEKQNARIAVIEVRGLPEGAVVRLDGKDIGRAPLAEPLKVGVGTHDISASAPGYERAETTVTVAGEDRRVVELKLSERPADKAPAASAVVVPPAAPPATNPAPASSLQSAAPPPARTGWWLGRKWTWVAAGSTVLLAAGATTAGVLMRSKFDDLSSQCGKDSASRPGCTESQIDAVDTRRNVANVLWALTGVAAVTTGALFYIEGRAITATPVVGSITGIVATGSF